MRQIFALSFVVFTIMVGFSMLFPVLPFWATDIGASPFEVGLIFSAYPLAQIIASPVWGRISDRYGYKLGVMVGSIGFGLTSLLIPIYHSVLYLIGVRFVGGLISSAALPSSSAYVGAISSDELSTRNFGIYGASLGLGIVVGPFIGGLSSNFGLDVPFYVSGAMGLLSSIMAYITLMNIKGKTAKKGKSPISTFKKYLIFLGFVVMLIMVNFEVILALFIKDRFGLGAREVGYLLGFSGLVGAVVQGNVGRITKFISEKLAIGLSFLIGTIISFLVPFSKSFFMLSLLVVILVAFSGISQPSLLSLLSKGESNRGEVMGRYQSASAMGRIVGPTIAGYLYSLSMNLPFLFAGILSLFMFFLWNLLIVRKDTG